MNVEVKEPTYRELTTLCKLNIKQLLTMAITESDEHIEKHFGGEKELIEIIQGYIDLTENLYKLFRNEMDIMGGKK